MTRLMTPEDVCEVLSISKSCFYRIAAEGVLRSVRVGGQLRVDPADLERYITQSKTVPVRLAPLPRGSRKTAQKPSTSTGYYPGMKVV